MYKARYIKKTLKFNFRAGTSRGVLKEKDSWFLFVGDTEEEGFGVGEISLIPGLSIDDQSRIENVLDLFCMRLGRSDFNKKDYLNDMPAVRFGIETALRDLEGGSKRELYKSAFIEGKLGIPINGLIWMNEAKAMLKQVREKLDQGFRVLKFKVGAIAFEEELNLIKALRGEYSAEDLEIRLDANGGWEELEAVEKLKIFSEFDIHSLEQPIKAGKVQEMMRVCKESPIDIALDEELIGVEGREAKEDLLKEIMPTYIILKPSLLGGISESEEWIEVAESAGIGWWITSALESNVGLNAIAQWTAGLETCMPQGLGTGMLYSNNISSPLEIRNARLWYDPGRKWDFSQFEMGKIWK